MNIYNITDKVPGGPKFVFPALIMATTDVYYLNGYRGRALNIALCFLDYRLGIRISYNKTKIKYPLY